MPSNLWRLPVNLAIGVHLLFFLGIFYLPGIFEAKPKFADIYTVSLINIAEPISAQQPDDSLTEVPPTEAAKPAKTENIAPILEKKVAPSPAPAKAISLKPSKRKKKRKIKTVDNNARQKQIDRRKRQSLADNIREEELLAEKARLAREALENERQLLKPTTRPTTKATSATGKPRTAGSTKSTGSTNLIEAQYYAAISNRLMQFWTIPEHMSKTSELTAVVGITISKSGQVADMFFESKSGDRVFDQFVSKTIEAATPFPPIPAAMKKQRFEIGLRFSPNEIQ